MSDILNKTIVLVLNRNWQAINIRTPADAFCQMATDVATALEIDGENHIRDVRRVDHAAGPSAGQRCADSARRDPCADGHRGGQLRQGAEEAPEALRED